MLAISSNFLLKIVPKQTIHSVEPWIGIYYGSVILVIWLDFRRNLKGLKRLNHDSNVLSIKCFFQILKYYLTYTITYFLTLRRITDIKCEFCNRSPINYDVILKFKVEPNTTLKANPRDKSYPKLSISDARKLKTLSRDIYLATFDMNT